VALPVFAGAVASAVILRTAERHGRDDFRQATGLVMKDLASGREVIWNADTSTPQYYARLGGGRAMEREILGLEVGSPEMRSMADVIYINRPDLRHAGRDHRELYRSHGFALDRKFTGFEVWRKTQGK
jgi:hypothetical protein